MKTKPTIVFTGGGTAGHVMPNLALFEVETSLAKAFERQQLQIVYCASRSGLEKSFLKHQTNLIYKGIWTGKLRRYWHWRNFVDPFFVVLGFFQSLILLLKHRPSLVFSKGGFCVVPVVWAAWVLRIPIWVHESDSSVSLSTRLTAPFAQRVFFSFSETIGASRLFKSQVVGLPIRLSLKTPLSPSERLFDNSRTTLLVMGGSLGSQAINQFVGKNLDQLLLFYNVIHLTGPGHKPETSRPNYWAQEQELVMGKLFQQADILFGRSGANTLFEAKAFGLRLALIPLPSQQSRGDQDLNARRFSDEVESVIIPESNLQIDLVLESLASLSQVSSRSILEPSFNVTMKLSQEISDFLNLPS
jgi:UDP-N-acetylglucosamine--N-acetylmuramyl-(pentapeptide) pyrophosphoryl-undecaprenol N-acetylglucosamine transferase